MNRSLFFAATALGVVALAGSADARPNFPGFIPNGTVVSCGGCHVSAAGGGPRNSFGMDVESRLSGGSPDWAQVVDLDSDNDGQTNGEELGDPCGTWMVGQVAPRTTDISQPGDSTSTSADPSNPSCDGPDAGMPDMAAPDMSSTAPDAGGSGMVGGDGCRCAETPSAGDMLSSIGLLAGLALTRRRRRSA